MEDSYIVLLVGTSASYSAGSIGGELIPSIIVTWTNQTLPVNQSDVHHISLSHWFYKGSGTKTTSSPLHRCSPPVPSTTPSATMDGEDTTSRPVEGEEENSSEIQLEPTQEEMERERLTARAEQVRWLIHFWHHWNQQWHAQHFLSVATFLLLSLQ